MEPLLKPIYQDWFEEEFNAIAKAHRKSKAIRQGWKRDRNGRIKWQWKMLLRRS